MARPAARIAALEFCFLLGIGAVIARAAQLQIVQGARWSREASAQRTEHAVLPARRGTLFDRNGVPLAVTQEFYHVGIAPNEVTDRRGTVRAVAAQLKLPTASVERDLGGSRHWIYYGGPFTASQVQPLHDVRGVHLDGEFLRFYPARDLARPVIGTLAAETGAGGSGLELALDSLLTGVPGEAVLLKDRAGRRYDSPSRRVREPRAGDDVYLTLDASLQEIAERSLESALASLKADGGDIVFLDPTTGEVLAIASRQTAGGPGAGERASSITDPFEPGSTAKLFTAAALLTYHRVDSTDTVAGENGVWRMPVNSRGRVRIITDAHRNPGRLTLAQAIQVSSNIAMSKFAQRLSPEEQFGVLRDFGFGSPTGIEFPSESRGRLERPDEWQPLYTRASVAMGYEFGVTPVQLAAAYGAIANDGVLLTPTLVREVRDADGSLLYRHDPEPVRHAVRPEVAARLRRFLAGVVGEGGTGERAQLANYALLGKTGTAVRFSGGRYVHGEYTASFAALFPADHPQLVVIVKIDNPKGAYYGGQTAAPLTKSMLQQALASRRIAIDRSRLAEADSASPAGAQARAAGAADADAEPAAAPSAPAAVVEWPIRGGDSAPRPLPVPDVAGSDVRDAALALHRRGFRVDLRGVGRVSRTSPAAGQPMLPGTTVIVWAGAAP
ncbi:MAG TPA: penicillin-binding transpeptidase domain-containing protein [Gemmatimonadales bacterium]|nr:penicillin-binding transpeptidase domain-containing protein [Gemmatimonadales bacterium]